MVGISVKFNRLSAYRGNDRHNKAQEGIDEMTLKTLHNSDVSGAKENVPDLITFGNGDLFTLLSKASSKKEGWMKSTKAMEIEGVGCLVQVTTQQGDNVAEALVFVPGVCIKGDGEHRTLARAT